MQTNPGKLLKNSWKSWKNPGILMAWFCRHPDLHPPGFGHLVKYLVKILSLCVKMLKFGQNTNICAPLKKFASPYKNSCGRPGFRESDPTFEYFFRDGTHSDLLHQAHQHRMVNLYIRIYTGALSLYLSTALILRRVFKN